MGLGLAAIQNTLELWQQGYFEEINSVAEMGSQELHVTGEDFRNLIQQACLPDNEKYDFAGLDNWPSKPRCSAKHLYRMLGAPNYDCFDLNKEHGAIEHDLNHPIVDTHLYGKYDLVTDHGSCEHVFNIAEAYRTMHSLCKQGGFLVISQALWGGNGYFHYDKPFFEGIAAANGYRIIFDSYVICLKKTTMGKSQQQFHVPLSSGLLQAIDLGDVDEIGVYAVLEKLLDGEFQFPYQGNYLAQRQHNAGFNRVYYRDPPAYSYIPEYTNDNASHISGKTLAVELLQRLKAKISW